MILFSIFYPTKIVHRSFHISSPRHVHPALWYFLKPALKGVAWITGRSTRKWIRQLPTDKRAIFFKHLQQNKYRYLGIFGIIGAAATIHYYTHLETVYLTERRRYMLWNKEKLMPLLEAARDNIAENHVKNVLPVNSRETQYVARVAKQIIGSNMDIPDVSTIKWNVRVITGDIFVYLPFLQSLKNEDQLAIVLGHEIAHAILGHQLEQLSYSQLIDNLAILGVFIIWSIFPSEWTSFLMNYIFNKILKLSAELPLSRHLEEEADIFGLMLTARACYDIRESISLWEYFHEVDKYDIPQFVSTHPSHLKRSEYLQELIPWALDIRTRCSCSTLTVDKQTVKHEQDKYYILCSLSN